MFEKAKEFYKKHEVGFNVALAAIGTIGMGVGVVILVKHGNAKMAEDILDLDWKGPGEVSFFVPSKLHDSELGLVNVPIDEVGNAAKLFADKIGSADHIAVWLMEE